MNGAEPNAIVPELTLKQVATTLAPSKHNRALFRTKACLEISLQLLDLIFPITDADLICHVLVQGEIVFPAALSDANLYSCFAGKRASVFLNLRGPSRRKEESLTLRASSLSW